MSVEQELIARASHSHPLFNEDNMKVCYLLEEAVRGTEYAASLHPWKRHKNGRAAWYALINQYAGQDKWNAELKKQEEFIHQGKWKGQNNYPLASHIAVNRNAFISVI